MFVANPYKFTKTTLERTKAGTLQSSKEEVEQHLSEKHSDENQWEDLGHCDRIEKVPEPVIPMDTPTWKEIVDIMKKSRSAFSPGQNGIPYKVYKKCQRILKHLWRLLKVVWRKEKIPLYWQQAEGCFIPKEEKSENVTQFRTISVLNVEGKIFFSVLARRMTSYMTGNRFVDTSVQKAKYLDFGDAFNTRTVISQLIQEAKVSKKNLTVVWLDLVNAYGTIPHTLIEESLKHYTIYQSTSERLSGVILVE